MGLTRTSVLVSLKRRLWNYGRNGRKLPETRLLSWMPAPSWHHWRGHQLLECLVDLNVEARRNEWLLETSSEALKPKGSRVSGLGSPSAGSPQPSRVSGLERSPAQPFPPASVNASDAGLGARCSLRSRLLSPRPGRKRARCISDWEDQGRLHGGPKPLLPHGQPVTGIRVSTECSARFPGSVTGMPPSIRRRIPGTRKPALAQACFGARAALQGPVQSACRGTFRPRPCRASATQAAGAAAGGQTAGTMRHLPRLCPAGLADLHAGRVQAAPSR